MEANYFTMGFPGDSEVKASACNAGDLGSIPRLGRSPGEGNGNPLQYSCLENPMDGAAWWAIVHGFTKSWTRLSNFSALQYCVDFCHTLTCIRRRQWHPTPVLLPGKSHGWRSLVGCSPWGREESDMTEWLPFHFSLPCIGEGNGNLLQCSCLENLRDGGAWWLPSMGSHRVGHDWSDLAAAAADMHQPWVYMCPLSWTPLPPLSSSHLMRWIKWAYYTEWSKSERKTPIQYINAYIWNLERW